MKYAKSNDKIPAVEMKLAKIVQNAKANNLGWTRATLYRDADNRIVNRKDAVKCCAIGAALLSRTTKDYDIDPFANDNGIGDNLSLFKETDVPLSDSKLLGLGFRLAMRD